MIVSHGQVEWYRFGPHTQEGGARGGRQRFWWSYVHCYVGWVRVGVTTTTMVRVLRREQISGRLGGVCCYGYFRSETFVLVFLFLLLLLLLLFLRFRFWLFFLG